MAGKTIQQLLHEAVARHQRGNLAGAEELYRQILSRDPKCADALHLLGVIAHQSGRNDLAAALIQRAIVINPSAAIYHNNLGEAFRVPGQIERARACYEKALAIDPRYADAHVNLGTVLQRLGRDAQAAEHYRLAISAAPDHADAHLNLGNVFHAQGCLDEAEACQRRAIELDPRSPKAHSNLGIVRMELGRPEEVRQSFRRAMELDPSYAAAHSNLLLSLHYDRGDEPAELFEEHRLWAGKFAGGLGESGSGSQTPHPALSPEYRGEGKKQPPSRGDRCLRVGFISPDFCSHPVAAFVEPLLAGLDRSQFEILAYSDVLRPDATTQRLAGLCDQWRDITTMNDEQVADVVRQDRLDILVDLAGHTARNRLLAFARRPAPVQITWLGYPNTTGLTEMDYRLTDARCDPPGTTEHFHTEELLRVEPSILCYRPPADAPPVTAPPAAAAGHITFGSFNNFAKVTPQMLRTWAKLLRQVPRSRLILKAKALSSPSARDRVCSNFHDERIEPDRIELLGQEASYIRHLELYRRIDIALDTFPYCGTATTCEALWMGVPVVTRAGRTHVSRVGCSILSAVGVSRLIASKDDEYVPIAAQLAEEVIALAELRAGMRQRLLGSALCDQRTFTQSMAAALRASVSPW